MKTFLSRLLSAWALPAAILAAVLTVTGCSGYVGTGDTLEWSLSPEQARIAPGGEATFTVTVQSKANINAQVALRVEGLPSGWTATFGSQPLPDTASQTTLTVRTPPGVEVGTYHLQVIATEVGGSEVPYTAQIIVETSGGQPDFTLEVTPAEYALEAGGISPTITYYTRPLNGFGGTISISLSGLTDDLAISQPPTPQTYDIGTADHGGAGGTFVLRYDPQPPIQSPVDIVVTATSGSIVHTRTLRVTLPAPATPDIEVSISPESNTLTPGPQGVTFAVTVRSLNGFSGTANIAIDRSGLGPLSISTPDPPTVSVAPGEENFGRASFAIGTEVPLTGPVQVPVVVTAGSLTKRVNVTVRPPQQ